MTQLPANAKYFFDGVQIGTGDEGLCRLKKVRINAGDSVRVLLPLYANNSRSFTPYQWSGLLNAWMKQGVRIEYYVQAELHTLTWTGYTSIDQRPDEAVYIFDGKEVGRGQEAVTKIKDVPLKAGSWVLIFCPWVVGSSSPISLSQPDAVFALENWWKKSGVRVVPFEEHK